MRRLALLMVVFTLLGCPPTPDVPSPRPDVIPDSDLCGAMCKHIGPQGLKCEEGEPLYNSDVPGPVNVPNQSCGDHCKELQERGVFVNPKCVLLTPTCNAIEAFRQRDPSTCNAAAH